MKTEDKSTSKGLRPETAKKLRLIIREEAKKMLKEDHDDFATTAQIALNYLETANKAFAGAMSDLSKRKHLGKGIDQIIAIIQPLRKQVQNAMNQIEDLSPE